MKKSELELILSEYPKYRNPKASLEQYQTPADIAAEILILAYLNGDIKGKTVADLGCGTGVFAVGASLLRAKHVIAIDIDPEAIELAKGWAEELGLRIEFIAGDISLLERRVDTVLSNPPFGVQTPHADREFLEFAISHAEKIYMLHYAPTEGFVREQVSALGGHVIGAKKYKCLLPHGYPFHKKEKKSIEMVLMISRGGIKNERRV